MEEIGTTGKISIGIFFIICGILLFLHFKKDFKLDYTHIKGYGLSASLVTGGVILIIGTLSGHF